MCAPTIDANDVVTSAFDAGKSSTSGFANVASNGSEYVIAYPDRDGYKILLRRWRTDGQPLDPMFSTYTNYSHDGFSAAALVPNGDGYLALIERSFALIVGRPRPSTFMRERLESTLLSRSLISAGNAIPLTAPPLGMIDGPGVENVSGRCGAELCAVV